MKIHIIRPNIWYVSTIFVPYSDIDSSTSETVKYDHPLWTLVSFFPPMHGFSSTIYVASLHDAYFQLLRCCRAIKGTDLSSATHWYKIGWDPRFLMHCARAHRSRFCRAFRSYSNFAVEFFRADDSVIVVHSVLGLLSLNDVASNSLSKTMPELKRIRDYAIFGLFIYLFFIYLS